MKKALIIAATMIALTGAAQSNEIKLKCLLKHPGYSHVDIVMVSIDPKLKKAHTSDSTMNWLAEGIKVSGGPSSFFSMDGNNYSFHIPYQDKGGPETHLTKYRKYTIDRTDLSISALITEVKGSKPDQGSCIVLGSPKI